MALDPKRAAQGLAAIAYAQWEMGDRGAITKTLRRAWDLAHRIEETHDRVGILGHVGEAQAWTGDPQAALETAREMREIAEAEPRENDRFFLSLPVVELLTKAGDFDTAFRLAELAPQNTRGVYLDRIATTASSPNHYVSQPPREFTDAQRAERLVVLRRILKVTEHPSIDVVIALGDLGETEEAWRLARRRGEGEIEPTALPWVLTRIAIAQARFGHPDVAKKTLEEALGLIRRRPEISDRLGQVAGGQAIAGDFEGALKSVGSMPTGHKGRYLIGIADAQAEHGDRVKAAKALRLALDDARACLANPPPGKPGTLGADPEYWRANSLHLIATAQAKLGDFSSAASDGQGDA